MREQRERESNPGPSLQAKVAFLCRPDSHADHPSQVQTRETHMSWVFMTEHYVYKLKKPVRHTFLDFSSLDARHQDCREELRLNRRLAPNVYLGIVALTLSENGYLQLGGDGVPVEWLVKMRRLPAERMLDHLIRTQQVKEQDIHKLTCKLARFYQNAEAVPISQHDYRQHFLRDVHANHQELSDPDYHLPAKQLNHILNAQLHFLEQQTALLDQRIRDKRIIEAHGDLRPEHICLIEDPVFIDCLEFNREFRTLDPAHELAYLALECQFAGADFIGPVVFQTYCRETGDHPPESLIHFYKTCRAGLRAKLAIWHIKDHELSQHAHWIRRATAYLKLAEDYAALL